LEVAEIMLREKRFLYVGFMCHQVVEKIFKGCYTKLKDEVPPFTHELPYLAVRGGFYALLSEEQKDFIDRLNPLNIRARYPDYRKELAKELTASRCRAIMEDTKRVQQWIKEKLL
jgi:HEPN domain-containing protein